MGNEKKSEKLSKEAESLPEIPPEFLDPPPPTSERSSAGIKEDDNIDKIMSEIEELREDMKATVSTPVSTGTAPSARATSNLTKTPPLDEFGPQLVPEPVSEEDTNPSGVKVQRKPESSGVSMSPSTKPTPAESVSASGEEGWLEETYAHLKENQALDASSIMDGLGGALTLLVQGSMAVRLRHETTGQEVGISFVEDSIHVYLADGAELRIPLRMKKGTSAGLHGKKHAA
ncbi:MAG: hypothetical protein HYX41_02940 [Bdellovibrio sp.]|nr:hypothetical protein [Bdellovibrio sp.]